MKISSMLVVGMGIVGRPASGLCLPTLAGLRGPTSGHLPSPALRGGGRAAAAPAAAFALGSLPLPAHAVDWDKFWYELNNEPPITLSPFEIHPIGWLFIVGYASYLGWQVFGPASEAEQAWAAKVRAEAEEAAAAAPAFLAEAAEAEGATVTPSGLVYQELAAGTGGAPTVDSMVKVHYKGTLADGTVFDSSYDRGEPAEFKLGQVIQGWQEGLALMSSGGKAVLTIPSSLAYGEMTMGKIPGKSALRFEVELMEVTEKKWPFG